MGSIGVISVRPVLVDALRRAGARVVVTKTGPFKDLGAPWREPTEEDEAHERELVDAIFRRFTGAVRSARGYDEEGLARVTTGEVWLGTRAVELGLIDGLADDEDTALEAAQDLASLPHHLNGPARRATYDPPAARRSRRRDGPARGTLARRDGGLARHPEAPRLTPSGVLRTAGRAAAAVEAEEHGEDDDEQDGKSGDDRRRRGRRHLTVGSSWRDRRACTAANSPS